MEFEPWINNNGLPDSPPPPPKQGKYSCKPHYDHIPNIIRSPNEKSPRVRCRRWGAGVFYFSLALLLAPLFFLSRDNEEVRARGQGGTKSFCLLQPAAYCLHRRSPRYRPSHDASPLPTPTRPQPTSDQGHLPFRLQGATIFSSPPALAASAPPTLGRPSRPPIVPYPPIAIFSTRACRHFA